MSTGRQPCHRDSHDSLLMRPEQSSGRALDAIVVPAARPAYNLLPAFELAAALNCVVVALCSRNAEAAEAARLAADVPGVRWATIDLPPEYDHHLLRFKTSAFVDAIVGRLGDLSLKRNLGLLLGRLAGWRSILFLDDDMRDLDPTTIRQAAAASTQFSAVGLVARDFPDNSVVCHAHRLGGGRQGVFVSGSALVVDCSHVDSFFPRVYNEDWLFLADRLVRQQVSVGGTVRQLPYQPFADTRRASAEEFGDVLAEGLVNLVHQGCSLRSADAGYWRRFLTERKEFIDRAAGRIAVAAGGLQDAHAALDALQAAERRRALISPLTLQSYIDAWHRDLASWCEKVNAVPHLGSLAAAVQYLGLRGATVLPDGISRGQVAAANFRTTRPIVRAVENDRKDLGMRRVLRPTPSQEQPDHLMGLAKAHGRTVHNAHPGDREPAVVFADRAESVAEKAGRGPTADG